MIIKLTKKQQNIIDFIANFTEQRGFSPSYREIMNGMGLKSVSSVAEHIENLVAKGALEKHPGEGRSLVVVDLRHEETVRLFLKAMESASEDEQEVLQEAAEILGVDLTIDVKE